MDWYNNNHRHSGINFLTPSQRHASDHGLNVLKKRDLVYKSAKLKHPGRWTKATRDWSIKDTVCLNPEKADNSISKKNEDKNVSLKIILFVTTSLTSSVDEYVKRHLAYAGAEHEIFTEAGLDEIFKYSGGHARLINKLCTHCLLYGGQNKKRIIDDHMVKQVIQGELS